MDIKIGDWILVKPWVGKYPKMVCRVYEVRDGMDGKSYKTFEKVFSVKEKYILEIRRKSESN